MKLSKNSKYKLPSYFYKVISQLVCEIISFENVIRCFRSRNKHRVMCLYHRYRRVANARALATLRYLWFILHILGFWRYYCIWWRDKMVADKMVQTKCYVDKMVLDKMLSDKMVRTKCSADKMLADKMVRTKWHGQNGTDKLVRKNVMITKCFQKKAKDFELAAIRAFQNTFPMATITGCMFHFGQCVWRKLQSGFAQRYRDEPGLLALAFIPTDDVIEVF